MKQGNSNTNNIIVPKPGVIAPFYQFNIGTAKITAIQDYILDLLPEQYGVNANAEEVKSFFESYNIPSNALQATINTLLIEADGNKILLDAGIGDWDFGGPGTGAGRLRSTLEALGIEPESITHVFFSHFHPDHVAGVLQADGSPAYANALHYIAEEEWVFLNGPATGKPIIDMMRQLSLERLSVIEKKGALMMIKDGEEVVAGLTALAAPGHSPGHFAYRIDSDNQALLLPMDSLNHVLAQLIHTDWMFMLDILPNEIVKATREKLFGMAADDAIPVWAPHLPFPGVGYLSRNGKAFQYTAGS
jgi:glyoxylase-like metal-dependent hydrolase (beta-lactamase superfamily II)